MLGSLGSARRVRRGPSPASSLGHLWWPLCLWWGVPWALSALRAPQLCSIFRLPMAIVSMVDKERQWFKSVQGLAVRSTERRAAFCAWTFLPLHPEVLVVPDALQDGRCACAS